MSESRYVRKVWDTHEEYMADCERAFAETSVELEPAQEAVQEFYEWMESLPIKDAELALKGIEAYQDDVQAERDIRSGHLRLED